MFVYRNTGFQQKIGWGVFGGEDEGKEEREDKLVELEADEFTVLSRIGNSDWATEEEIILSCRAYRKSFFSRISDDRIKKILNQLFRKQAVSREFVETDLEEEIVELDIQGLNEPACANANTLNKA